MNKVLVCDDEVDLTDLLSYKLKQEGFEVETVTDARLFIKVAKKFVPQMIILDVMMPNLNGFQLCTILRADPQFSRTPIIFLTAKGETEDRIRGLELGAEDYIVKPFDNRELLLRIRKVLRQTDPMEGRVLHAQKILTLGGVSLYVEERKVTVNGAKISLTNTEFKLLLLLIERVGRVQSRENLLISVWHYDTDIETRTVDTHVRRLREKLGEEAVIIETIRGVGYRGVDPNLKK